ncbi:hypothetical protein IDG70_05865, partial [Staphylococcus sp. EG-SA-26]|uniref:hypothetical protein n=1 Tax=Staphylococcus sp. EG-SA-26 TaxID=2767498 RepID=UPI001981ADA0
MNQLLSKRLFERKYYNNMHFGIGWASSGVEYAQAYRAKLLRRTNQDTKFVFLDFIQSENI